VTPSPLVVRLIDSVSSYFTIGTSETSVITLTPGATSENPNEFTDVVDEKFSGHQFICKADFEEWPAINGTELMALAGRGEPPAHGRAVAQSIDQIDGCFGEGVGAWSTSAWELVVGG